MLFSSLTFLLYFLPAVLLVHYILPKRFQNTFLLLVSLVFYAWGELGYLPLIAGLLAVHYFLARGIGSVRASDACRTLYLVIGLICDAGALFYFKYASFIMNSVGLGEYAPEVSLPLGISFFTFQAAAYLIDIYKKDLEPEKNIIDLSTFILLFPQLIAGPILRYQSFREALHAHRKPSAAALENGMTIFIVGLSMKVLLANPMGELWKNTHLLYTEGGCIWLATAAYTMQIYFDFFGYSLMAIGIGRMLGLFFPKNFDQPYSAYSVTDFWRRWHITLSGWFRDYVYIPLGGNRKGKTRMLLNMLVVWVFTGLWHGAGYNFVLWGMYYFVLLTIEKLFLEDFLKKHRLIGHFVTPILVGFGWLLFSSDDLLQFSLSLRSMFSFAGSGQILFWLKEYAVILTLCVIVCMPTITKGVKCFLFRHTAIRCAAMLCLLILCVLSLVNSSYNPFLYFRF